MKNALKPRVFVIPKEVSGISEGLKGAGFRAYLVGGCVRDLILGLRPKDWDITTDATPDDIAKVFPKTFYENEYGTVGVVNDEAEESLKVVEVTPFRKEIGYSDSRRPDRVVFGGTLEDDLKRRDFSINAIAMDIKDTKDGECDVEVIDNHQGLKDISSRTIVAVGKPEERFAEDGLRLLRALRLSAELGFKLETETAEAIKKHASVIKKIAMERVRDEFVRIIMSDRPGDGFRMAESLGVLKHVIPELSQAVGVEQNKAHSFDVFEHLIRAVEHSAKRGYSLEVRLASLFHDIGKPPARRWSEEKGDWTFHGHDVLGAKMTVKILERLKFQNKVIDKVSRLVLTHMFFTDTEKITLSAVRRLVAKVGKENIWELMNVRAADRIGTGRPKESPYRLRKYHSMVEEAMRDPITVSMLRVDGSRIMEIAGLKPGPRVGYILHALLEEVLDAPEKNTREFLEEKTRELSALPEEELKEAGERGKERRETEEDKELSKIRKKYWVK
ncbi:MAG: HD domain-containing protein [Candidatus Taylorbacteria bacterium]|nr:HD domain-containing protein [Candidatus Taylorbacteria bacterium]